MQGTRGGCRWRCRATGNEPHDFSLSNEKIRHLREAVRLIWNPLLVAALNHSFAIFNPFDFLDSDIFDYLWPSLQDSATYGSASLASDLRLSEPRAKAMLKISILDTQRRRRLVGEGKLVAP